MHCLQSVLFSNCLAMQCGNALLTISTLVTVWPCSMVMQCHVSFPNVIRLWNLGFKQILSWNPYIFFSLLHMSPIPMKSIFSRLLKPFSLQLSEKNSLCPDFIPETTWILFVRLRKEIPIVGRKGVYGADNAVAGAILWQSRQFLLGYDRGQTGEFGSDVVEIVVAKLRVG